jgi:uncharacterized tellurite resistance protein B-like protein
MAAVGGACRVVNMPAGPLAVDSQPCTVTTGVHMSFFRQLLNLDAPASPDLPIDPQAPLPDLMVGDATASVKRIAAALGALPPARARYVAAFAYLLGRAAHANLNVSQAEKDEMKRLGEVAGLDPDTTRLVVELALMQAGEFGATEDYLVTREFKAISTVEERHRLVRACFMVMAADDEVDATEAWLVNRVAEELDLARADLNAIRAEFHERLSAVRAAREVAAH